MLTQIVLDPNKKNKPCFVDLAKAFDSVNLELLWFKLAHVGLSSKILHKLQSIYSNANSLVYFSNLYSKPFPHSKGMRQGCNLSPLYCLFTNDLEDYLKNHSSDSCQLNSYRLQLMMFTDDIVLLDDTEKGLQGSLNRLEEFCSIWDQSINIQITKIVILINLLIAPIYNSPLEQVKEYNCLGILCFWINLFSRKHPKFWLSKLIRPCFLW